MADLTYCLGLQSFSASDAAEIKGYIKKAGSDIAGVEAYLADLQGERRELAIEVAKAMGIEAAAPVSDLLDAPQTGKSPSEARAEAEAAVRAQQSKLRKPGGNDGDAGPLFDDQPDLLDAPKASPAKRSPTTGAELIQRGRAILQRYSSADDEAYNKQTGTDLRASLEGLKLADDLLAAKTMDAKQKVADKFVLESGKRTGNEHLVVLDADGVPLAMMMGASNWVSAHAELFRAADAGVVAYATHNHPQSTSHSGPDLSLVFAGFSPLVVMGHDGSRHEIAAAPGAAMNWEGKTQNGMAVTKPLADAFQLLRDGVGIRSNRLVNDMETVPRDEKAEYWKRLNLSLFPAILDRMGVIRYSDPQAIAKVEALGINFEDFYGQVSGNGGDGLRQAGLGFPESGRASGNQPAGSGAKAASPGSDGANRQPESNAGNSASVAPATTDNDALNGALDDLFGDDTDVSGPGNDLERPGRDGEAADDVGAGDVPASARPSGRGTGRRGAKAAGGNGQRPSAGGVPDGDAPAVGSGGNPGADGGTGADSEPAAGGNGGRRAGGGRGRLPADGAGKGDAAGDAAGSSAKLTPAQRLAAIRGILKEDVLDFVAGPERRDGEAREFAVSLKAELGLRDLSMFVSGGGDLRLSMIAVPRDQQGQGIGTEAMERIVAFADERSMRVTLSVGQPDDGFGTTSRARLVRFYKRFGFVENAGRNKDFALSPGMYRNPRSLGLMEETVPLLDPRKAEALQSIFIGALDGVDVATATDRDVFRSIILPLKDAGMTRAEVAELSPYLEAFLADLRAGRVIMDPEPAPGPIEADDRAAMQAAADKVRVKPVDRANIDATLPLLLPEQRDDVHKVETRFAKPDGHGMMITNGTGTGKTFSGGGVIKRFVQQGKTNVLIIAPSDAVIEGWTRALDALAVPVSQLAGTKDAGRGVVITTYANLRANDTLASRDWDLVVTDEAQNLLSNADGAATSYLQNLRAITNRPADLGRKSDMIHADDFAKHKAMADGDAKIAFYRKLAERREREVQAMRAKPRSKVLFLSATPFAYDKTVDYAEGYLFNYPDDGTINGSNQSGRNLFMVRNFGYRIRYHKLTRPEHAVDSAVFEREFHEQMKRDGVLSGRSLQVDVDYDRRFVKKEDADGTRLDEALEALDELARAEREAQSAAVKAGQVGARASQPFTALQNHMRKNFDYLARQQLLEAIKARLAVDEIKQHLALGRKVVVFHDFNVGGGLNPFTHLKTQVTGVDPVSGEEIRTPVSPMTVEASDGYRQLLAAHPWIAGLNFSGYKPPVKHLPAALGKAVRVFNGNVPTKQRLANLADFNTDGSGVDVLVVQADAGGAGISMHDISNVHQRALINLGMPTKPTTTLQQEGRILRVGSKSDAIFRYFTIGTGWERTAFAQRIAERSGTVENLALGDQARDMMNAFIDAYMDAADFAPSAGDGKGGKAKDSRQQSITPYERAVSHYFGRPRISGRRDQRDGLDFYPTAEPLAYTMVQWAGLRPNERVLEPSAGDGAIVRYMPDDVALTFVEPSADLRSTAQLRAPKGDAKETTFEQHHISNKYHAVVMNPPFGSGGSTAMQHLAKAAKHLRDGGRIVALIPTGPSADKKFDAWWNSDDAKDFNWTADISLPSVAFERAGTGVMTRVVILDKITDLSERARFGGGLGGTKRINFTGADDIREFFDRLERYDVPRRPDPKQDAVEELEAETQDATSPIWQPPGPALATEIGSFAKTTITSKKGKVFPAAHHAAKVERDIYDQMKAAATALDGWWHKNDAAPKGSGPTFAFRTESARDAFLADMQKPTARLEETGAVFKEQRQPVSLDNVIIAAPLSAANSHPDYEAAKAGDLAAGVRLAQSVITADLFAQLRSVIGNTSPTVVPVVSLEATGRNKIPTGAAAVIADHLGLQTSGDIIQINSPKRTALSGLDRIFAPPVFGGEVAQGADYLLVDDAVTEGATFAALGAHIVANGGRVVGAVALTGKQYSATLRLTVETLAALRAKHGDIEPDFQAALGYGFDALTESEARYLASFKPAATVRNRVLEARSAAGLGVGQENARRQVTRAQLVREAASATEEIARLMPALRGELDRLNLKRVRLSRAEAGATWQGAFVVTGDGELEIVIGASLDPVKTLHHEVIHALRAMNLFTPEEWQTLTLAAKRNWMTKHDIAARYPDLTEETQIEEAIAEEFSEALAKQQAPKGSMLIAAFNKIARIFRAIRNVMNGAGYQTPEDIFGRVLAGEIGARNAGNTGAQVRFQRQPLAVRPLTAQARAHRNSAMGATPFIPDRRVWESLTRAGIPIWQRLRDLPGAASDAVDGSRGLIQDRMLPFLRAQEAVMRQTGRALPKEHDAYLQETTFSGKVGRHLLEVDEEFTKPIIQIIAASKGKITADSVGQWLYARHAIERNAYIASINPNMPDGGSGMESIDAAQILADVASQPEAAQYDRIGQLIDDLRERNLRLREDSGLISTSDAALWRSQYKHYVPLKGFEETDHYESMMDLRGVTTGRRFSIRGGESRRALGRQSEAFNPLQSAITQAQEVAIRAEKNRVARAMFELAASYPSKALWEVKRPQQKRYFNRTTGLVETRVENPVTMVLEPNEMAVKIDGKEHRILFNDQRLAESAGTLGADQMQALTQTMSGFSRYFSMVNTMLSPAFVIANAIRDFATAQIMMAGMNKSVGQIFTLTPKQRAAIMWAMTKNWRKAMMGAMRGQTYRFDTEWSAYYREFQKAGGQVSFWVLEQPEAARNDLDKRIRLARGNAAVRGLKAMTSTSFFSTRDNPILSQIERVNLAVDNAIRLAAFVEARKQGLTVEQAAFLSKELTVNFNRRGKYGAAMNAYFPFFNAAVQGTTRLLQGLANPALLAGVTVGGIGLGLVMDAVNAALSDEDDDGELLYDKIPDYRNARNLHIHSGNGSTAWAVPLPYGFNIFPYAGQQIGKVMRGVKKADEAFGDVMAVTLQAYLPTDTLVPTVIQPTVEVWRNENFFGRSIYPEDFFGNNKYLPDAAKFFPSASEASKALSMGLNKATGGNELEAGLIDLSPEVIDHYAGFIVGGAGRFWGNTIDGLAKILQGKADSIETKDIPFVSVIRSEVSPWIDRDRFKRFSAEVRNANHDLLKASSISGSPSMNYPGAAKAYGRVMAGIDPGAKALAGLYEHVKKADRELAGEGEFRKGGRDFVRLPRSEKAVIMDFNNAFLKVAGKQGE